MPPWYYFINPLCWILFILDFVAFIFTFKWVHAIIYAMKGKMVRPVVFFRPTTSHAQVRLAVRTVRRNQSKRPGRVCPTPPRLCRGRVRALQNLRPEREVSRLFQVRLLAAFTVSGRRIRTVYDMFSSTCQKYPQRKAFGTRKYLGMRKEGRDKFPRKVFGETAWKTYAQAEDRVNSFGKGLIQVRGSQDMLAYSLRSPLLPSLLGLRNAASERGRV